MSDEARDLNLAGRMIPMKGGKEYLQVADRIVWFRRDYPEGTIETTIISIDEERGSAIFRARVTTGQGGVAEATGDETLGDFPQGWIGKAETKAVGRALGYLGYGTASAGFEEGPRVVDAPQAARSPRPTPPAAEPRPEPPPPARPEPESRERQALAYLRTIRDDTADPAARVAALDGYYGLTRDVAELNRAADKATKAGLPEDDLTRAYREAHARLARDFAPAAGGGG